MIRCDGNCDGNDHCDGNKDGVVGNRVRDGVNYMPNCVLSHTATLMMEH